MSAAEMRAWLHRRLALADAATDGPWQKDERWCQINQRESGSEVVVCFDDADSEFIADARTSLPATAAALLRVLYVDEDELPSRAHDTDYQEGVSDALLHVKKVINDVLKEASTLTP